MLDIDCIYLSSKYIHRYKQRERTLYLSLNVIIKMKEKPALIECPICTYYGISVSGKAHKAHRVLG